ncbi:MAG: hypothetical protein COA58_14905 [Bacteroidetes bacterium]|nr:MAG: hypothetical protein COA58_14905 [Bacteroidota bacterium]
MHKHYLPTLVTLTLLFFLTNLCNAQTTIIAKNATWKYLDDGSNQGTSWQATAFSDVSWSSGTSVLGYGSIGGITLGTSSINNNPTTYFRKSFTLTSTAYDNIDLNLLVDDGAVVYLNGTQLLSDNMPGTWSYSSFASGATSSEDDYENFVVPSTALVTGTNVIAVEVHNANATSSDLGFDLEVILNPTAAYIVNSGDNWDYLDDSNAPTTGWNSDTNWSIPAAWDNGPSLLAYGTIDGRTTATALNNVATTVAYFRTEFTITDTSVVSYFDLDFVRDDGIVIYVNGVEVHRDGISAGTVTNTTEANQSIGGADEGAWNNVIVTPSLLHQGTNIIAASVHQVDPYPSSSDIGFDLRFETLDQITPSITRGPYIQNTTDTSAIVRWSTDVPSASSVQFGTVHGTYGSSTDSSSFISDHEIMITGLTPDTKYYYHLSTDGTDTVGRYDNTYFFKTAPTPGDKSGTIGMWILGDQGQTGAGQTGVHTTFLNTTFRDSMDIILMLGDNAYNSGTDAEFTTGLFNTRLDSVIRNTPMYSTVGNHEVRYATAHSISTPETTPYYQIYNFPTQGEGGGLASGTESYYSWDYGNVHFMSINAEEETLDSASSTMWSWCKSDLQQNTMDWIIVIVHQGPYTKGSHNSDSETEHVKFRENFLPLLERYGVDLTMSGHSHSYERSKFVKGHYGTSGTYSSSTHDVDGGFGRMPGSGSLTNDCAYEKVSVGPTAGEGAIYCTAGSSSKKGSYSINHPVMSVNWNEYGSVYVEVNDNKLSYWFLQDDGDTTDYFQILKDTDFDSVHVLTDSAVTLTASWPEGPYLWSTGATTRSITTSKLGADSTFYVQNIGGSTPCMIDSFKVDFPSLVRYPFTEVDTVGMTSLDADGSVVIRATEHTVADANGWYYYYNTQEEDALVFAVRNSASGGNTLPIDNVIDYVEVRKANIYNRLQEGTDSFLMVLPIDWNVAPLTQPNGGMDIKFYFDPAEMAAFTVVADSIDGTNTDLVTNRVWFKASQGGGTSFLNSDITVDSVANFTDLTSLLVAAPNYTTGVGSVDGTAWINEGNGKNFIQFNGLTSFSGGGLSQTLYDPTPIPLSWLAFNASWIGKNAQLIWQTASERNSDYFTIERLTNDGEFMEIGRLPGGGNSNSVLTYQFEDVNASSLASNRISYRIKQVDFDGSVSYSNIRTLTKETMDLVSIYPNPAQEEIQIEIDNELLGQNYNLEIYNLKGDLILKESLKDSNKQSVSLTDMVSGHYVVVIRTAEKLFTYRLIKE